MAMEPSRNEAVEGLKDLRDRLRQIEVYYLAQHGNYRIASERLWRWRDSAVHVLRRHFRSEEVPSFEKAWGHVFTADDINFDSLSGYLGALLEVMDKEPDLVLASEEAAAPQRPSDSEAKRTRLITETGEIVFGPAEVVYVGETQRLIPQTKRVLLIHGHDQENLRRLADLLHGRGLEPVILRNEPARGRTIIEKFEQVAATCAFAFVLMTPDDQLEVRDTKRAVRELYDPPGVQELRQMIRKAPYAQARPNVIFELGWMYGRLSRDRVCILFQKGTHMHSDLEGIERFEFSENVEEVLPQIERELMSARLLPAAEAD